MKFHNALLSVLFILLSFEAGGAENRPFSAYDLVRANRLLDPQISSDGRYVAFVVRETDMDANQAYGDIWVIDLAGAGAGPKRLTTHEETDVSPQWSRDGRTIYFLSGRSGTLQIWAIPLAGGEATQISDLPVEITSFKLSPDGEQIAFTALVYPDCQTLECSRNRAQIIEEDPENGLVYDQLLIRYWDKWRNGQKSQLFVAEVNEEGRLGENARNILAPLKAEVPAYPIDLPEYVFSADGKYIYFSTILQTRNESWTLNSDLYRFAVGKKREPRKLTGDNPGSDSAPAISPDGKWLAWLATDEDRRWAAANKIRLMNLKNGNIMTLGDSWDRSPVSLIFTRDSSAILALSDHLGEQVVWRVPLDGGAPAVLAGGGQVTDVMDSPQGIVFSRSDMKSPADLFLLAAAGESRLTQVNGDLLGKVEMGDYEQFSFEGAGRDTVYGYAVHPAGYSKKRKYPVVLIIHGGPHGSMGNSFHYRWNPQIYANAGYGVVFVDFHGSTGYGQAFAESIHGDRGGVPLEDNQKGLQAALERFPWLDGNRVCAMGASFGGYMMNIIEGAWPDRFRCLVNHDGMFDNRMKYYAGDIIGYLEEGFGGRAYFEDPSSHEKFNPVNQVAKWKTPMLVIHSEKDYRVPITHSIGAFTALQRLGIASRLLYFPDENHWVLSPGNSLQWHREVIRWLDQWLKY